MVHQPIHVAAPPRELVRREEAARQATNAGNRFAAQHSTLKSGKRGNRRQRLTSSSSSSCRSGFPEVSRTTVFYDETPPERRLSRGSARGSAKLPPASDRTPTAFPPRVTPRAGSRWRAKIPRANRGRRSPRECCAALPPPRPPARPSEPRGRTGWSGSGRAGRKNRGKARVPRRNFGGKRLRARLRFPPIAPKARRRAPVSRDSADYLAVPRESPTGTWRQAGFAREPASRAPRGEAVPRKPATARRTPRRKPTRAFHRRGFRQCGEPRGSRSREWIPTGETESRFGGTLRLGSASNPIRGNGVTLRGGKPRGSQSPPPPSDPSKSPPTAIPQSEKLGKLGKRRYPRPIRSASRLVSTHRGIIYRSWKPWKPWKRGSPRG